jgi:mRNA interferase MazF
MKRGSLVTIAGGADYAGKPRPALVVQSDAFPTPASVTVCPLTTKEVESSLLRIGLLPTAENGLAGPSWIMVDKILTVPRTKVGQTIGEITLAQLREVTEILTAFLGAGEQSA